MIKNWLLSVGLKFLAGATLLGIGVWYLSSSIGGASLSYINIGNFLNQVGIQNGDIATVNGCFLCNAIEQLFGIIGQATEQFWTGIVNNLWILMAIGFGIFIILHTISYIREQATSKEIQDLSGQEPKLDFKKWFEKIWKTGIRVMICGALIGALNWSGTSALKVITNITVSPVMYVGSTLAMATTKLVSNAQCGQITKEDTDKQNILDPVLKPFMCVMGNLNTVMLAGAGGGFALMNYAWADDLNGGVFTWLAGLALVILFLIIGFDLVFQVLNVIFKLIFIIIFMPFLLAAAAFEEVWKIASKLVSSAIDMLVNSAVSIIKISLKVCIIYAIVYFSADAFYPGPVDGFTTIMPPLLSGSVVQNTSAKTEAMSVMAVFSKCEKISLVDNETDKDKFLECFKQEKIIVEREYPHAFDFMEHGFDFFLFMIGIGFLYFWVVSPKVDEVIGDKNKDQIDFGTWVKDTVKTIYNAPVKIFKAVRAKMK